MITEFMIRKMNELSTMHELQQQMDIYYCYGDNDIEQTRKAYILEESSLKGH